MKSLKKIVSLLIAISIFISIFTGCSTFNLNNVEAAITKAEWIENLGRYFGMDDYQSKTPLFKDLTMEDSVYPYAQSCAEWNVIAQGGTFNGEKKVTKEYALATCVYGLGAEKTGISIDNSSTKKAAEYAYENGIAQSKSWSYMHQGVTIEEANKILQSTLRLLSTYLFPQYNNSKYADKVKIPAKSEKYLIDEENEEIIFDNPDDVKNYNPGDVLIVVRDGVDVPAKIEDITVQDGQAYVSVTDPELKEVYETIDVSSTATVTDPSDIKVYDGFELDSFSTKKIGAGGNLASEITQLKNERIQRKKSKALPAAIGKTPYSGSEDYELKQTWFGDYDESARFDAADFSFNVGLKNGGTPKIQAGGDIGDGIVSGKVTVDPEGNKINIKELEKWASTKSIPSDKVEAVQKMANPDWAKGSWEVNGKLKIKDFYVQASAKGNVFDWGSPEVKINCNYTIEKSLEIKGKVSIDKNIGDLTFHLGPTPFQIVVSLALTGELSASLKLTCSISNNIGLEYSHGNLQKHTDKRETKSVDFEGKAEVFVGPRVRVAIGLFKLHIDIANLTISVGIKLKATPTWTNVLKCSDGKVYRLGGDEEKEEVKAAGITFDKAALFCIDLEVEFPVVKLSFCDDPNTLLSKVGVSYEGTIVGKNGIWKIKPAHKHWENFKEVKPCTVLTIERFKYKDEKEEEETTTVDESEQNGIKSGYFDIDAYAVNTAVGETANINITALPEGAGENDISVEVNDTAIATATVSGTVVTVTGLSAGTTTLNIVCGDKLLQCMVMVTE